MNKMKEIGTKSVNGHMFTCSKCDKIHFEFNQIGIDFSSIDILRDFYNYLVKIDGVEFETLNKKTTYQRKIHIPFPNTAIKLLLSLNDLNELITLIHKFIHKYNLKVQKRVFMRKLSNISSKQLN
ncbi:hypothetical protein E9993_02310 [Labilibacter sediminis]|nr:hypothetical protein E9993_02310 [Labilibacter sediminis]